MKTYRSAEAELWIDGKRIGPLSSFSYSFGDDASEDESKRKRPRRGPKRLHKALARKQRRVLRWRARR